MSNPNALSRITSKITLAVREAHAAGMSDGQIAQHLGIPRGSVEHHRRRLALPVNSIRKAGATVAPTPWDAAPGDPRPETAPRDGTKIGEHVTPGATSIEATIALIRAAHTAWQEAQV